MFDSGSGDWVEHRVDWGIDSNAVSATVRYMDGVLYLLARTKQVVCVRLDDMSTGLMELPEPMIKECCVWKVGGRLHYSNSDGQRLRIWASSDGDEEGGGWLLKHCVSFDKMEQVKVFGLHPERDVVYLGVKGRLVAYDVCEKRIEEAWELEEEKGYLIQVWVFPFSKYLEHCLDSAA
ncbi:uncharacterized protein A4U43_C04F28180 [Asparagus officinalis]|uniref:F-box associated domain-containing protein n=1 Tax=Asparagus officinalis TaxID=4686 RepID=A0A5P1F488_ASPOF|nr:uncharacterized protein A4U43_C04F28180 [Asparagus officinalis]